MPDTHPELNLSNLTAWAIREATIRANADPASRDAEGWESAYCRHLEDANREAGLVE